MRISCPPSDQPVSVSSEMVTVTRTAQAAPYCPLCLGLHARNQEDPQVQEGSVVNTTIFFNLGLLSTSKPRRILQKYYHI